MINKTAHFILAGSLLAACTGSLPADNPYDPEAPLDQQQKASIIGSVLALSTDGATTEPLLGANVVIDGATVPNENSISTEADGRFGFENLTPGQYNVDVSHPAFLRQIRPITVSPGETRDLEIILDPGATAPDQAHLTGVARKGTEIVRPPAEQDHSGILVEIDGRGIRTVTNSAGEWDIFLAAGTYDLTFSAQDHVDRPQTGVEAIAAEVTTVPDVQLDVNPGTVAGIVMRRTCEPNPDDEVQFPADGAQAELVGTSYDANAGTDGSFAITGVAAGIYTLRLSLAGHVSEDKPGVRVRGGELVDLTVEPTILPTAKGVVSGKAMLAGESDHSGTVVQLTGTGFVALTSGDGSFRIEGVCAASGYELRATRDDFVTGIVPGITVTAGQTTELSDVTLPRQQGGLSLQAQDPPANETYTRSLTINYALNAPAGTTEMRLSEDQDLVTNPTRADEGWEAYLQQGSFDLSPTPEGTKTVYGQFRDGIVTSAVLSDVVVLDLTAPVEPAITIGDGGAFSNDPDGAVIMELVASDIPATDANLASGLAWMRLFNRDLQAGAPSPDDAAWDAVSEVPYSRFIDHPLLRPLNDEPKETWVRFADAAMNWSDPVSAQVTLDRELPQGPSVTIVQGASGLINSTTVSLQLAVTDNNAGIQMRLANDSSFVGASWRPFAGEVTWFLTSGAGPKEVWVEYADVAGNAANPVFDTTDVDLTPPAGSIELAGGASITAIPTLSVLLTHPVDTIEYATADNLLDCATATYAQGDLILGSGTTTTSHTLSAGDGLRTVVVCFRDGAGNRAQASATIELDTQAPTSPQLSLNPSGVTNLAAVTATVGAVGATRMCFWGDLIGGSGDACATLGWEDISGTKALTIPWAANGSLDGDKTISVRFRDAAGWESAVRTEVITLDTQAPALVSFTLDCGGAVNALACNNGLEQVLVNIAATGVAEMRVANDSGFVGRSWESYLPLSSWAVTAGDSPPAKQVWLELRDLAGNVAGPFSDSIAIDTVAPAPGTLTLAASAPYTNTTGISLAVGGEAVSVELSGDLSEAGSYAVAPTPINLTGLDGEKVVTAVLIDDAGNRSTPFSTSIVLDRQPPENLGVVIDGGALYTTDVAGDVTLSLSAFDRTTAVDEIQISHDAIFGETPVPFVPSIGHTLALPASDGPKDVYVQFWDLAGNAAFVQATIELDTAVGAIAGELRGSHFPAIPDRTASQIVELVVTGLTAEHVEMKVSNLPGLPDVSWRPAVASLPLHLLTPSDGLKTVYVVARDLAGNETTVATPTITLDQTPPSSPDLQVIDIDGDGFALGRDETTSDEEIELTWNQPAGTDTFDLERFVQDGINNSFDDAFVCPVAPTPTSCRDDVAATLGFTHNYRIRACDDLDNCSEWSAIAATVPFEPISGVTWIRNHEGIRFDFPPNPGTFQLSAIYSYVDGTGTARSNALVDNQPFWVRLDPVESRVSEQLALRTTNQDNSLVYESLVSLPINRNETVGSGLIRARDISLGIDAAGKLHICYRDDFLNDLVYATDASGAWQFETIDAAGLVGQYGSLALDSGGTIHIGYYDFTNGDLKYATGNYGSWSVETVDSATDAGAYASLAVDGADNVHISHLDKTTNDLRYATGTFGSWSLETIDAVGDVGFMTALVVDGAGVVHISYGDYSNWDLKYATGTFGSWAPETVDAPGFVGDYTSIGIDGAGTVHISYVDVIANDVKYASGTPGSWTIETIAWGLGAALNTALNVDALGVVDIAYHDGGLGTLEYATNHTGMWETVTLDATGFVGNDPSIAVDGAGVVYVAHNDVSLERLKYVVVAPLGRATAVLDSASAVGQYSAIATDAAGKIHISYFDTTGDDLKYATNASGVWVTTAVDTAGVVGLHTSIAIDAAGKAHIGYFDDTNDNLKYATNATGAWVPETVDSSGNVGWYTSLAVDGAVVHISYYDVGGGDLEYATGSAGSWVLDTVDAVGDVGQFTSIAVDATSDVHISYYAPAASWDLKYATGTTGSWTLDTVASNGTVGQFTSLAVDAAGDVHMSYRNVGSNALEYTVGTIGAWTTTTVDAMAGAGFYSSLALDGAGNVHISYHEFTLADLRYATNASGAWTTTILDSTGSVGTFSSLAIDAAGIVHISYLDESSYDLKYTRGVFQGTEAAVSVQRTTPF